MKKLYVGNLPFTATDDQISQLFGQHGTVHSVALSSDTHLYALRRHPELRTCPPVN